MGDPAIAEGGWNPVPVTYLPDGAVRDETGAEFGPGQPW